jgi:predicted dehydrogenase
VRRLLDESTIGDLHLVTLQTFRTTHARGTPEWNPDWRRERRYSGGGIGMDHGSHTFYLAFDWMRSHPTAVSATTFASDGADTEDNFSCTLSFPTGIVTAHLSWTGGTRKVIYTLHGDRGAITVDDDVIDVLSKDGAPRALDRSRVVPSRWGDASHKEWFGGVLDGFAEAMRTDDFVGMDAIDAVQCIRVISAAYASARRGSREVPILEPLARHGPRDSRASARRAPWPPPRRRRTDRRA